MTLKADLYWSFRSPYSYLATARYMKIEAEYDIDITLRIVMPIAIRKPDFFEKNHPHWLGYVLRDALRVAQHMDVPFAAPNPDPIIQNMITREISEDQPYIHRLNRMGHIAAQRGVGLCFAEKVSQLIWGGVANWHQGDHLAKAAEACGLDFDALEAEAHNDAEALDAEIENNQEMLEKAGHWGVPTLVFQGEPFFGQDRIDIAFAHFKKAGLQKR